MAKQTPKKAKGDNLDDLKQELDIDFHKISPEELYQRFQTHPENVSENSLPFLCPVTIGLLLPKGFAIG